MRQIVRLLALVKIRQLRRLLTILEKLIHGNFQSPSHLLQRFDGGDRMTIFHPRYVGPKQPGSFLDVALGEMPLFA